MDVAAMKIQVGKHKILDVAAAGRLGLHREIGERLMAKICQILRNPQYRSLYMKVQFHHDRPHHLVLDLYQGMLRTIHRQGTGKSKSL